MLNELFELSEALAELGLLRATTHPNIGTVVKEACLLIELDQDGVPRESRLLTNEETAKLWRHSRGNHHSFPAIRIQEPLLNEVESAKLDKVDWNKKKISEKIDFLSQLDFSAYNPKCNKIKISAWSTSELKFTASPKYSELAALKQLVKVFPREEDTDTFIGSLARFFVEKLKTISNEAELDFIKKLLVGEWNSKAEKYIANCMTYYEVYELIEFPNLVSSPVTQQALVKMLHEREEANGEKEAVIRSPLSGIRQKSLGIKYPNPNLPILGQTYLYSKKSDTACLTRYGLSGVGAYEISKQEANAMNHALAFLTLPERENKTWKAVSDPNGERPNLLLAYLPDDPKNEALLAQIMSDPSSYDSEEEQLEEKEEAFVAICQQVLQSTETLIHKNPQSTVHLILLESLDAGRKQVVYERNITLEQARKNLISWIAASNNYPPIEIRQRIKKEEILHQLQSPGPSEMIRLAKINLVQEGRINFRQQSSVSLHDVYELYMPRSARSLIDQSMLTNFLSELLSGIGGLLSALGHLLILHHILPATRENNLLVKQAKTAISLVSNLLWHLNTRKENYMNQAPYNFGQLLQLADRLHKEYCLHVRNKSDESKGYPPQFMGNEILPVALEDPIDGLNRLDERMRIYLAWAETTIIPRGILAKSYVRQMREISYKIASESLPEQFGPVERAQLFLGYLATVPKQEKKQDKTKEEVN